MELELNLSDSITIIITEYNVIVEENESWGDDGGTPYTPASIDIEKYYVQYEALDGTIINSEDNRFNLDEIIYKHEDKLLNQLQGV